MLLVPPPIGHVRGGDHHPTMAGAIVGAVVVAGASTQLTIPPGGVHRFTGEVKAATS